MSGQGDRGNGDHLPPLAAWGIEAGPDKAAEGVGGGELTAAPRGVGFDLGQDDPERGTAGIIVSPSRRREAVEHVSSVLGVSERRACRIIGQPRSTQRRVRQTADDEAALTAEIVVLATQYGRYGYRRITALLRDAGWVVNRKRVARIWRREGLKVLQKQPKRGRLWLSDGSCIRLRAEHSNHVWAYDFVEDRTHDGRKFRLLCLLDEFRSRIAYCSALLSRLCRT